MSELKINKDGLLPCPFCGEDEDLGLYEYDGVYCGNCGCHAGSMMKSKEIQIEIWNTRFEK